MFFAKKGFRLTLLIISIIGVIIGGIYALDFLGVINVSKMLSEVPVVGRFFTDDNTKSKKTSTKKEDTNQLLLDANRKLADNNKDLSAKLANLDKEISRLNAEKIDSETKYNEELAKVKAENDPDLKNAEEEKYRKLAKYYGSMKPDAAVKILIEMDDNLVIEILNRIEPDQVSKILSKMDPKKAANLSSQMAN